MSDPDGADCERCGTHVHLQHDPPCPHGHVACPECGHDTVCIDCDPQERVPGFYDNVPEALYHGDRGSLSVSGAKVLLRAPALYRWQLDHPPRQQVWDDGTAAHALVLGSGMDGVYVVPFEEFRTNAAKAERDEAIRNGLAVVTPSTWARVSAMADALSEHTLAMRLLSEGRPEVSAYAVDEPTGVMRRGRFDWLGASILTDYKTAVSSDPLTFVRMAVNYGYHMQAAWYTDLARDLGHPAAAFSFLVQEKEPPYLVTVIELPEELVDVGRRRNRRALERFRDCTETDLWPGYVPDHEFAQPPAPRWALYEEDA